ncbi:LysR family transcriptional regulator [Janthinobacterium sp. B9-8]|uniref:LysR family transcriptional regulator n=1 Tax=Janthinobacterium sp. B9-8 TaxID=1236179 RepID=UPI00061D03AD|nr:LysR family transcriptional regulator [Janthinobacterium sp. B9-8]AMC37195.1 LysR family transcriptional regulator [Janthinobacterium sp. B9-8]
MDLIQAMRLFVQISDSGSFTRAAELMQLSRPVASTTLQQLENHLGTRLLSRTTRHLELTGDGRSYYLHCQRLLADLDKTAQSFRDSGLQGLLRIDVPTRIARSLIAPHLPAFFQRYPDIRIEMGMSDHVIDLLREGVDCVLRVGALHEERLVSKRLGLLPQGNYVSPAYIQQWGVPDSLAGLSQHYMVGYSRSLTEQTAHWEYMENGENHSLPVPSRITVNNAESYLACGLAGLGLIQVPSYDAAAYLASGELQEVLPQYQAAALPVSVLYPYQRNSSQRVQVFVAWVAELLQEQLAEGGFVSN